MATLTEHRVRPREDNFFYLKLMFYFVTYSTGCHKGCFNAMFVVVDYELSRDKRSSLDSITQVKYFEHWIRGSEGKGEDNAH